MISLRIVGDIVNLQRPYPLGNAGILGNCLARLSHVSVIDMIIEPVECIAGQVFIRLGHNCQFRCCGIAKDLQNDVEGDWYH